VISWRSVAHYGASPEGEAGFSGESPELPVVLMSGYSAEDLRARGLEQYPVPLVTKPFTQDELVAAVNRLLGTASRSAAS
jgi:CheY-like chemotaxis protein